MDRSAVILAGGLSGFMNEDQTVLELNGKPLIEQIIDSIRALVDDVVLVVKSQPQADAYVELVGPDVKFVVSSEEKGQLVDALEGFKVVKEKYCLLLSQEFALVSPPVVDLFFELSHGKTAVIPRWPNQQLESLQAVYNVKTALEAGNMAIEEGAFDVEAMIEHLGGVRYISTLAIEEFDPELKTFFKVNTPVDLKMAEAMAKPRRTKASRKR